MRDNVVSNLLSDFREKIGTEPDIGSSAFPIREMIRYGNHLASAILVFDQPVPSRHEAKVVRRRSIRLPGFDYTRNDSYFVTVRAANQACLLGRVINAVMHLSRLGQIVAEEWQRTVLLRPYVESDAFVVMPNHFHALFTLLREGPPQWKFESLESERSTLRPYTSTPPAAGSVGAIPRAFKAAVTRRGRVEAGHLGPLWQRNYYEHIIRNDQEYLRARDYIARNAESWEIDKENPQQRR